MRDERWVLDRPDAVREALGPQRPDCAPNARRAGRLAGVGRAVQPRRPHAIEPGSEWLRWVRRLVPGQTERHHAVVLPLDCDARRVVGVMAGAGRVVPVADNAEDPVDLDAE